MSLNWNLAKIANADTLCWQAPAEKEDRARGIEKGKQYIAPLTDALIWMTMSVDLGEITAKNAEEFAVRVAMVESIYGCSLHEWDETKQKHVDRPIRLADVVAHIGLSTNVSNKTAAQFASKVTKSLRLDAERRVRHDARKVAEMVATGEAR